MSINKYCVKNLELIEIEEIFKKHVNNYNKKFELYHIICNWKLQLIDTIIVVKSKRMCNQSSYRGKFRALVRYLIEKIEYFNDRGYNISQISEMNITFITDLMNMTYSHYITHPMQIVERELIRKICKNPELIKTVIMPFPAVRNYKHIVFG